MPRIADGEARRSEIIDAAVRLIAVEGVEALTMRRIAAEAGCTIGLINHWFDSKDDLIDAILGHVSNAAVARSAEATKGRDVPLERVVCEFLPLDEQRVHELRIWLAFWALSIGRPNLRSGYASRLASIRRKLGHELARRDFGAGDTDRLVDVLMSAIDGIMVNALAEPDYWTPERQVETLRWVLSSIDRERAPTVGT